MKYPERVFIPCHLSSLSLISWKQKVPLLEFTVHPHCGAATYVFVEKGRFIPITEFIDVEGFMEFLTEAAEEINKSRIGKIRAIAGLASALRRFIDKDKAPEGIDSVTSLASILGIGNREALAEFHRKALFIGVMHFQDAYNFDLERVKRCGIHYATPDLRIIPFCSYNAIHRPSVEKAFSVSLHESKSE